MWQDTFAPLSFHLRGHLVGEQMASFSVTLWSKSSEQSPWTHVRSVPSVKVTISARAANRLPSQTVTVSLYGSVCMRMYQYVMSGNQGASISKGQY